MAKKNEALKEDDGVCLATKENIQEKFLELILQISEQKDHIERTRRVHHQLH